MLQRRNCALSRDTWCTAIEEPGSRDRGTVLWIYSTSGDHIALNIVVALNARGTTTRGYLTGFMRNMGSLGCAHCTRSRRRWESRCRELSLLILPRKTQRSRRRTTDNERDFWQPSSTCWSQWKLARFSQPWRQRSREERRALRLKSFLRRFDGKRLHWVVAGNRTLSHSSTIHANNPTHSKLLVYSVACSPYHDVLQVTVDSLDHRLKLSCKGSESTAKRPTIAAGLPTLTSDGSTLLAHALWLQGQCSDLKLIVAAAARFTVTN